MYIHFYKNLPCVYLHFNCIYHRFTYIMNVLTSLHKLTMIVRISLDRMEGIGRKHQVERIEMVWVALQKQNSN